MKETRPAWEQERGIDGRMGAWDRNRMSRLDGRDHVTKVLANPRARLGLPPPNQPTKLMSHSNVNFHQRTLSFSIIFIIFLFNLFSGIPVLGPPELLTNPTTRFFLWKLAYKTCLKLNFKLINLQSWK